MNYGKIENGEIKYATIKHGALVTDDGIVWCAERDYPNYGYYPIKIVAEDGEPEIKDGYLIKYIGAPEPVVETSDEPASIDLNDASELYEAMERMIAANGATEEDKAMALARLEQRKKQAEESQEV